MKTARENIIIAVDYDGTIIDSRGKLKARAVAYIKKISALKNVRLCLWTARDEESIKEALKTLTAANIPIEYAERYTWEHPSATRKIAADFYIDDRGTPDGKIRWNEFYNAIKKRSENV